MNVTKILRVMLSIAVLGLALCAGPAVAFREMASVLEGFLRTGGWVVTTGQPFSIQSIFRHEIQAAPVYDQNSSPVMGLPAPMPLCLDDSDGLETFTLKPCGASVENQLFIFNMTSYALHSASKPTLCVTLDGSAANTDSPILSLRLQPCDCQNPIQKFMYNMFTYHWMQALPAKTLASGREAACLDDGGEGADAPGDFGVADCKLFGSPSQTLMVVPGPSSELPPAPEDGTPKLFTLGFPFRLRLVSSFLCVADNGQQQPLRVAPCTFNPAASQTFAFDPHTSQIKSVAKPWLCLSDRDVEDGESVVELQRCVEGDGDQQFAFDETTGLLTNPNKIGKCLDTNGSKYPEPASMALRGCKDHNVNQVFTVEGVSPLPPPELDLARH